MKPFRRPLSTLLLSLLVVVAMRSCIFSSFFHFFVCLASHMMFAHTLCSVYLFILRVLLFQSLQVFCKVPCNGAPNDKKDERRWKDSCGGASDVHTTIERRLTRLHCTVYLAFFSRTLFSFVRMRKDAEKTVPQGTSPRRPLVSWFFVNSCGFSFQFLFSFATLH